MIEKNKATEFIDTQNSLNEFVKKLNSKAVIGIDTEFERIRTYYPKLCLIQVASSDSMACIDCLANLDLSNFWELIYREDIEKFIHSGSQDLEIFYLENKSLPQNICDTQIAASLLGYPMQIGIKNLLMDELGINIEKTETRSDWSKRPLHPKQLQYAIEDVAHLLELGKSLKTKLKVKERLEWCEEDCNKMLTTKTGLMDQENAWKKIKGIKKLNSKFQNTAIELANWRENQSSRKNIPRKWLIDDKEIINVSKMDPQSLNKIKLEPLINKHMQESDIENMIKTLRNIKNSTNERKRDNKYKMIPNYKLIIEKINTFITKRAKQLGITQEALATKKDILLLVQGRESRLDAGWRKSQLSKGIRKILN